ncbi:MAG TPA: DUF1629 domain-containing protein [Archangium sp.]|nr:DUF1629 domain-containing protein [Archangium sp.]
MHDYFIFEPLSTPEFCKLGKCPEPFDRQTWRIAKGQPMGEHHPSRVRLDMDKRHAGLVVPDLVFNNSHLHISTRRLKDLLERESGASIEFLPVAIHDHKGRVANEDCYIANVLGTRDCVDRSRSEFKESALKPGQFSQLRKLQLDPERVDPEAKLFRIQDMPAVVIIRGDLRAALDKEGMTGAGYIAMGEKCFLV